MSESLKKNEKMSDIHLYFNWKCTKCDSKYESQPSYCHECGCNHLIQINPEYRSLLPFMWEKCEEPIKLTKLTKTQQKLQQKLDENVKKFNELHIEYLREKTFRFYSDRKKEIEKEMDILSEEIENLRERFFNGNSK